MSALPYDTSLGKLSFLEIYDDYDGPKFFSAINQFRQIFVVYWVEHNKDERSFGWLYLPISEKKLNKLRRTQISSYDAFSNPEQGIYFVQTFPDKNKDTAEYHNISEIDSKLIPPESIFIDPDDIEIVNDKEANWVYQLIIKKAGSNVLLKSDTVSSVLERFRDIFESLMSNEGKTQQSIYPLNAVPGSFDIKLSASDNNLAIKALIAFESMTASDEKNIEQRLRQAKLDPFKLKALYEVIQLNNITIEVTPKTFTKVTKSIKITKRDAEKRISNLEELTYTSIESIKIPQANDIEKVIQYVELKKDGKVITYDLIEGLTSQRQVAYYRVAAYSLGLLDRQGYLTSAGRFLLSKKSNESRYQVLVDRFESSDFGWGWMRWSNVNSLSELDPNTAAKFLIESVPMLSADTANRRAKTLIRWLEKLKPHHRDQINIDRGG